MKSIKDVSKERAKKNLKKVGDVTFVRAYGPNSYRFEKERDGEKGYYHIYINSEDVETCPLCATEREVKARFHELLEENGIEWTSDDDIYVRKKRN